MGKHVIEINPLDPKSVDKAVRQFEQIAKELDKKIDQFLKEIAEVGRAAAQTTYGSAIQVTVQPLGNGEYSILASGEPVVFFEFGAGSATDPTERYAKEMPFLVHRGSYSLANEGEYAASGFVRWHFGGNEYRKVDQRPGMLRAYEAIKLEIPNVAKRVFG